MNKVEVKVFVDVQDPKQVQALNALFASLNGEQIPQSKTEAKKEDKPKVEKPKEETTISQAETKEETSDIKIEEVRALLAKKIENNRAEIKTKLTALNAPNVTALDKAKYSEFVEFLKGLK